MSRLLACLLFSMLLAGCNLLYRPEMQQGNPVTPEMLAALKPGLTKRQVRLVLGSPPVSDPFHPDRWEYVYSAGRAGDQPRPPPRLTLYFVNDQLVRADGEQVPAELRAGAEPAPSPKPEAAPN
jgi:outer membrane protein assembly factor BamE